MRHGFFVEIELREKGKALKRGEKDKTRMVI